MLLGLVVIAGLFPGRALASNVSDHERARAAVESGDVIPLALILEKVESIYEGSIIEVELEDEGDEGFESEDSEETGTAHFMSGFIYEIKLLTPQGNLLKLKMDARTGEVIEVRGQGEKQARKNIQAPEREQEP
ncbi:MAG: PepSY domain-containing protein [Rhodospirillales bacterium]|nr:PepSY domain-containing protein [Rhodospirillales bacterium]